MSKYNLLWEQIDLLFKKTGSKSLTLSFLALEEMGKIKIDHSFLTYKKELNSFGYKVEKISLKLKQIIFSKI